MIKKIEQQEVVDDSSRVENKPQQNQTQMSKMNKRRICGVPQIILFVVIFCFIFLLAVQAYFKNLSNNVVQQQQAPTITITNDSIVSKQNDQPQSKVESEASEPAIKNQQKIENVKKIEKNQKILNIVKNETEVPSNTNQTQPLSREAALQKYYSEGLKTYYENIQQEITVMRWVAPTKEKGQQSIAFVNGLSVCENQVCLNSIQSILNYTEMVSEVLWLVSNRSQTSSSFKDTLEKYFSEKSLSLQQNHQEVDVSYSFLSKNIAPSTKWIFFLKNGVIIKETSFQLLRDSNTLAYVLSPSGFQPLQPTADLSSVPLSEIDSYGLCFNIQVLRIITPLNFAFQNVYSLNELILLPVLTLAQTSLSLEVKKQIVQFQIHAFNQASKQPSQLQFTLSKYKINQSPHICIVSSPTVPSENSVPQIVRYLSQLAKFAPATETRPASISAIISVIYSNNIDLRQVMRRIRELFKINIEVRVRWRLAKVFAPLEVYELYYGYCPSKSVIFASRFNVVPILNQLGKAIQDSGLCSRNQWFMIGKYLNIDSSISQDLVLPNVTFTSRTTYLENFEKYFSNAQILCMELVSEMRIEIFKWQQLQFYETEASFAIPGWERAREKYYVTNKTIYKIEQSREMSDKQRQQIQGMAYRDIKSSIGKSKIVPLQYCELNNFAFKRNPPELIPRIIHQIWLSDAAEISPIRKALMKTLKLKNPQFQHRLWKLSDVTRANFPITYDGIIKFEAISKQTKKNYRALIADLMRIEILYKYGGIYMDLKIEGKKSLLPFLKYEKFYLIANQQNMVNGLIGAVPGNRHLATILRDYFDPAVIRAPKKHIYEVTGGTKLIQAYTRKQLYTQVCNFQPFILQGHRPCVHGSKDIEKGEGQEQFKGISGFVKRPSYRVLIPCKLDSQKYLDLYDILGRTYFPGASKFS